MLDRRTVAVVQRFLLRVGLLAIWSYFAHLYTNENIGLLAFATLSLNASFLCALVALYRSEPITLNAVNHWDEAILFILVHLAVEAVGA